MKDAMEADDCSELSDPSIPISYASTTQKTQSDDNQCIICYDRSIDCVMTPCGHQMCCSECAKKLSTCPVCNANCEVIKVYK